MEQESIPVKFFKGSGCINCDFSGYKGRIGVYEILVVDNDLRAMINKGSSTIEIENALKAKGFKNFTTEALSMISNGVTDLNELSRVISLTSEPISIEKAKNIQPVSNQPKINADLSFSVKPENKISKTKILVVEDDNIMQRIVASFLKKEEIYEVLEAVDGEDALQMVAKHLPDLILLDILMPKMDGYEVCRNLRGDPKYSKIPIIMLSSLEEKEDLVKGFDLGIDDYISKPVDQQVLIARVTALLRRISNTK